MTMSCDYSLARLKEEACAWLSYQLESAIRQGMPSDTGFPDIAISQRRIVLAITGTRPTEKMSASAAGAKVSNDKSVY
jgi:hypothetical protein